MHAVIANKIADCLSMEDRTTFLFGSIAPDAVTPKELSHFFKGEVHDYTRHIDYKSFIRKYSSQAESHYVLGYYTHLIADDIWLRGFNLSWLKNRMDANKELYHLYHNDFRLLNGKILEYYGLKDELRNIFSNNPVIDDLQEVKSKDVKQFIPYVLGDMEYDRKVLDEKLNVFMFDQIIGYIETSVDLNITMMKGFKYGTNENG